MIIRILVWLGLIVFAAGFIWFAGNVIWLRTKAFFTKHNSPSKITSKKKSRKKEG